MRYDRIEEARKHTLEMDRKYAKEIANCIKNTVLYDKEFSCSDTSGRYEGTFLEAVQLDSVSAIFEYNTDRKIAVLNFASFKYPGGGYASGSMAQEEALCSESFLYNVLREFKGFYQDNRRNLNKGLYSNRALYTPNVRFFKDKKEALCDVITCAAPNKSSAKWLVTDKQNSDTLKERVDFILGIARENKVDTLILGAYGCGVFGQNPMEVAELFREQLKGKYSGCFMNVIFAIVGKGENLPVFKAIFNKQDKGL